MKDLSYVSAGNLQRHGKSVLFSLGPPRGSAPGFPSPCPLLGSPQPRLEVVKASGCSAVGPSGFDQPRQEGGVGAVTGLKAFQRSERDPEVRKDQAPPPPRLQREPAGSSEEAAGAGLHTPTPAGPLSRCHGARLSSPHPAPSVVVGTPSGTAAPPGGVHGTPTSCLRGERPLSLLAQFVRHRASRDKIGLCKNLQKAPPFSKKILFPHKHRATHTLVLPPHPAPTPGLARTEGPTGKES